MIDVTVNTSDLIYVVKSIVLLNKHQKALFEIDIVLNKILLASYANIDEDKYVDRIRDLVQKAENIIYQLKPEE